MTCEPHNGPMLRQNLPEFLFAALLTVLFLVGYAMRGVSGPESLRTPRPVARVHAAYLVRIEHQGKVWTFENDGKWAGGRLNESERADLRQALAKLSPASGEGESRLVYFSDQGQQSVAFRQFPTGSEPLDHVLEMLSLYGFQELKAASAKSKP